MTRPFLRTLCFCVITPLLLVAAGWYAHGWYHLMPGHEGRRCVRLKTFHFISPLLDVELPDGVGIGHEPIPFKYKIREFVDAQTRSGAVKDLTVYYRDLFDGPWFAINGDVVFNPASMMKVPVMVAWLRRAEKEPQALKRTFVYDGREDLAACQGIRPAQTIIPGRSYTVEELLQFMMNYSDNNATKLLYEALGDAELNEVLDSMDVNNDPRDGNNAITAHGYSGFFRILYNASYLNREMSEKALQLLSLQEFPQGMAAGVPKGVPVAAKFGETGSGVPGEDIQLHEFGIVYHPKRPYILGIMTRGHDLGRQAEIIRSISARVYAEVDRDASIARGK